MRNVALFATRQRDRLRWLCPIPHGLHAVRSVGHHTPYLGTKSYAQCRGAKTQATYQLSELPKRSLESTGRLSELEDVGPAYPTVVLQALNNMQKYKSCVLLTRVGSFYEVPSSYQRKGLQAVLTVIALLRARRQVWTAPQSQSCPEEDRSRPRIHG